MAQTDVIDPTARPVRRRVSRATVAALPLTGAAMAWALGQLTPAVGALMIALLVGALLANIRLLTPAQLRETEDAARWMLRLGVVLLGLQLPVREIATIGVRGAVVIGVTVALTFTVTRWIGRRLGLDRDIVTLIAAGFSICGAAAIAAVSDVTRASRRDVGLAVAMVTIFGGLMIVALPWAGHLLGLGESQTAVWAGASIHEVAQVAAAASLIGAGPAVAAAMLVKLGRVACLAPVCWLVGRVEGRRGTGPAVPWFVVGFVALSVTRSVLPLPDLVLNVGAAAATLMLAAGMLGLGLGLRLRELWPLPRRVLLLAAWATTVAAGVPLTLVLLWY